MLFECFQTFNDHLLSNSCKMYGNVLIDLFLIDFWGEMLVGSSHDIRV